MQKYPQRASRRPPPPRQTPVNVPDEFDEQEPASPQYAGHYAGLHAEDAPFTTAGHVVRHLKASRPAYEDDELEARQRVRPIARRYAGTPTPMPDGVIYRQRNEQVYVHNGPPPMPQRASRGRNTTAQYQIPRQAASLAQGRDGKRRPHWLVFVGLGLLAMLIGYVSLNAFGAWLQVHSDDGTYGRPRTFQTDAVVGHGDSQAHPSHFIAMNLNRHVIVIEIPGGDVSRAIIYTGPVLLGNGQDLTPVTLSFADINGDGKLDMILHILGQDIAFFNNGTKFVPPSSLARGGSNPPTFGGFHAAAGDDTHASYLS